MLNSSNSHNSKQIWCLLSAKHCSKFLEFWLLKYWLQLDLGTHVTFHCVQYSQETVLRAVSILLQLICEFILVSIKWLHVELKSFIIRIKCCKIFLIQEVAKNFKSHPRLPLLTSCVCHFIFNNTRFTTKKSWIFYARLVRKPLK